MSTIGAATATCLMKFLVYQNKLDIFELILSTVIVFLTVTAYFMSLRREAKLQARLALLACERDDFIRGLPDDQQVLILPRHIHTKQILATPQLRR